LNKKTKGFEVSDAGKVYITVINNDFEVVDGFVFNEFIVNLKNPFPVIGIR